MMYIMNFPNSLIQLLIVLKKRLPREACFWEKSISNFVEENIAEV